MKTLSSISKSFPEALRWIAFSISILLWSGVFRKYLGLSGAVSASLAPVIIMIVFAPVASGVGRILLKLRFVGAAFAFLIMFSAISSPFGSFQVSKNISFSLVVLSAILFWCNTEFGLKTLSVGFRATVCFVSITSILMYVLGISSAFGSDAGASTNMFSGLLPHKTALTNLCALGAIIAVWSLIYSDTNIADRIISLVTVGTALPVLALGGGGQAALFFAIACVVLVLVHLKWKFAIVTAFLAMLALGVFIPWAEEAVLQVSQYTGKDPTLAGRSQIWSFAKDRIMESPVIGHGFVNIGNNSDFVEWQKTAFEIYFNADITIPHLHNQWIEITYMFGFVGLFAAIFLTLVILHNTLQMTGNIQSILFIFLAYFLIISTFSAPFLFNSVDCFVMLSMIVLACSVSFSRNKLHGLSRT